MTWKNAGNSKNEELISVYNGKTRIGHLVAVSFSRRQVAQYLEFSCLESVRQFASPAQLGLKLVKLLLQILKWTPVMILLIPASLEA